MDSYAIGGIPICVHRREIKKAAFERRRAGKAL
jgi:hypothetical protein